MNYKDKYEAKELEQMIHDAGYPEWSDPYEGHTEGPWEVNQGHDYIDIDAGSIRIASVEHVANAQLIADAPLLFAEVERLRGLLMKGSEDYTTSYMDLRQIIEDVHWELTGDEHESNEARIKHALIALREVIG